jgi:hypothetical protein
MSPRPCSTARWIGHTSNEERAEVDSVRCFHRQSGIAYYTPYSAAITVRLDTVIASEEAITHELTHHDLTGSTLSGMLDRLLGLGAADTTLADADRERFQAALQRNMGGSATVHEATATYVAALGERVADRHPTPLDELPPQYRNAVHLYLGIPLDDPYGAASVSFFPNYAIAVACARAALDSPDIINVLRARPRSPHELFQILFATDVDGVFRQLVASLRTSLEPLLEAFARFLIRIGVTDAKRLDEWFIESGRRTEHEADMLDAVGLALHEMFPDLLGAYLSSAQKADLWADFLQHCQSSLVDEANCAYFADVVVTRVPGAGIDPEFVYLFSSVRFERMWRWVRSPPVRQVSDAVAWLHDVAAVAIPRGLRVVLHGRELFNEREVAVELSSGELVPSRGGIMHLDLQVDRVKANGESLTAEDVEVFGRLPQSVSMDWRTRSGEEWLYAAIEALGFPIVWHAGWLSGFGAAKSADAYQNRPGRTVFYLDQSGGTWRIFEQVLLSLTAESPRDVIRADFFDGASDAYVIPFGTCACSAVFPNRWISTKLDAFEAVHPGSIRQRLESEDSAQIDPLVRYGMYYIYNLVR